MMINFRVPSGTAYHSKTRAILPDITGTAEGWGAGTTVSWLPILRRAIIRQGELFYGFIQQNLTRKK